MGIFSRRSLMRRLTLVAFIFIIVLSVPLLAQADEKPLISVLDFKTSGISRAEVEVFVDFLSSHIIDTGKFRVIDRMQREALLREMEFSYDDCTDEGCQLEVGRLLAANQIVVGSVGRVGERYLLTIKLIDVQTGEAIKTGSEKYTDLNKLIDDSERLAQEFATTAIPGEEAVAEEPAPAPKVSTRPSREKKPAAAEGEGRRGSAVEAIAGVVKWIPTADNPSSGEGGVYGIGGGIGYVFQFSNRFSLGGYVGLGAGYESGYGFADFVLPMIAGKFIFGNKVDGLAFAVDLGLPSGVGIYYKNFFAMFDVVYFKLDMETILMVGAEVGYSFYFGR
jgi:TolB-like protein